MPAPKNSGSLAAVLAICACAAEPPVGGRRAAITNGGLETGYLAVFALAYQGYGACTGTCVTPKVGTTATHCLEGDPASSFSGLFGNDETAPVKVTQVTATASAPDGADLALVAFAEACPAVIPFNRTPLEGHIGEPVVMVGFGVTTEAAEDAGVKRSGTAKLFSVDPAEVMGMEARELATDNVPASTCNGDSGGPTFMTFDGTEYMVGTTSRGSLMTSTVEWPCGQGQSIAVRADSYAAWIDDFIAVHDPDAAGGGGGDGGGGGGGGVDDDPGGSGDPQGDPEPPGGERPQAVSGCAVGGRGDGLLAMLLIVGALRRKRRV